MNILLPTDGSRYAVAAARALAAWFARPGLHVDLLHVVPEPSPPPRRPQAATEAAIRHGKAAGRAALEETSAPLAGRGIHVTPHVVDGDPREVALDWSSRGYDLVVVGARGRGEIPFFDVGSVALAVLERAPASVLMVRSREPADPAVTPDEMRPLEVVLAVDAGRPARAASSMLPRLLTASPVHAVALSVGDEGWGGPLPEHAARGIADRTAKELADHGLEASSRVEAGPVAAVVREVAAGADLVVLGSRSAPRIEDRELGSVALGIARSAPCSVLVLRADLPGVGPVEGEEEEREPEGIPLEITVRGMEPNPTIDRHVLRGVESLEVLAPDATRCDVTIERRQPGNRSGSIYHVAIDLTIPGAKVIVSRTPPGHRESETLVTALVEAFRTARHRLLEEQARARGDVKRHEVPPHGVVTELFPDYGFIQGSDGRILYFHRNSVLGGAWADLEVGSEVRYAVERGQEGPQASTVTMVGKHHPVG